MLLTCHAVSRANYSLMEILSDEYSTAAGIRQELPTLSRKFYNCGLSSSRYSSSAPILSWAMRIPRW